MTKHHPASSKTLAPVDSARKRRRAPRAGTSPRSTLQPSAILASLPLTKYHQIYLVLRQQLEEGRYAEGLPTEIELTKHFGVGRVTVRRALEQLAQEGLIVRAAGRGTRPTSRAEKAAQGHVHVHADL